MKSLLAATALTLTLATAGLAYADADMAPKPGSEMGMPDGPPPGHMDRMLAKLPAEKAALVRDAMEKAHGKNKPIYAQMHQKHEELDAIMTAQQFDAKAYLAKNAEIQKLHEQTKQNMDESFASIGGKLTQDERKSFVDSMHHSRFGSHGMKHGDKPKVTGDAPKS